MRNNTKNDKAIPNRKEILFVDYLKALGLLLIILAHTCDNQIIMNLRIFDVPLMVILSGFLAYDSYKRSVAKGESIVSYYKKRVVRLLVPTWIFLTFYFLIVAIISIHVGFPYNLENIVRSYLLLDGIGYVWIIRIYLICALITPFAVWIIDKIKRKYFLYIAFVALYVAHEMLAHFGVYGLNVLLEFVLAYAIPYGIVYFLGLLSNRSKYRHYDFVVSGIFLVVFVVMLGINNINNGGFVSMQSAKYPPTLYYLSYSLFVGFLLMGVLKGLKLKANVVIGFFSRSSLWIYLWHILVLLVVGKLHIPFWPVNYILVVVGASLITCLQNKVVDYLGKKKMGSERILKVFRG